MWQKIFKILNKFYYKRFFLVIIFFLLAFVFGKNLNVLTPEQQQLQDLTYVQQKMTSGIHNITVDQQKYELKDHISIKKGQCGRLFFSLKNLLSSDGSTNTVTENPSIKILFSNNFEQSQELGSYEIKSDRFIQNEEVEFCANADYLNLFFQKDEDSQGSYFEISSIGFYSLAIGKYNTNNLLAPIVGNTDFSKIFYQSGLEIKDASIATKFTRHNQMIGQTFVADSDMISGADMKLEFTGVGGIGNYYLELREIDDKDGKTMLSPDRIAYFGFDKNSADRDLKIKEGLYHVPLAAKLEKGKTYFIGINNEAVKFNILNTLRVYGGNASNGEKIITSIKGKTSEKSGNLYLKAYGADYVKTGDGKVLTGAKILDNGDGTGQYIYEQKGNFYDYLDLEQVISKENTSVFYDNIAGGISAKDEDDNAFIYKINTVYPFTKMKVEAQQSNTAFTNSLVYCSFDNVNWTEIKNNLAKDDFSMQADQNKFNQLIQGDGKTKTVYIKVTYDNNDAQEKATSAVPVHLFGLKNLKVNAQLNIKN